MAAGTSDLTPASVFAILLSLALVGGATIYYIRKKDEGDGGFRPAPHPSTPPAMPGVAVHHRLPAGAGSAPHRMVSRRSPMGADYGDVASPPRAFRQTQQTQQWAPQQVPTSDVAHILQQVAAQLRAGWQHGVDDVTVLETAAQNPSLTDEARELARRTLAEAHVEIHRQRHDRSPQGSPAPRPAPPVTYHPAYMPQPTAHQSDVSRAVPWQDYTQQMGAQLGQWAHDVESWLPHPDASHAATHAYHQGDVHAPPAAVTYTPYPMPQPQQPFDHPHDAMVHALAPTRAELHAHGLVPNPDASGGSMPASARGPTFWSDTARRLGLIKPGDRLINVKEAQHYLNTIGLGAVLPESGDIDEHTHEAIRAFQLKHHLPMTGDVDPETSSALLYQAFVSATPQVIDPGF